MTLRLLCLPLFAALLLAGCDRVDPDSPLGKRKAIYQAMLDTKEDLGGMLRGRIPFDGTAFTSGAAKLDELSRQPWQHYPEVKEKQSDARDDVWQRQERFQELARALEYWRRQESRMDGFKRQRVAEFRSHIERNVNG